MEQLQVPMYTNSLACPCIYAKAVMPWLHSAADNQHKLPFCCVANNYIHCQTHFYGDYHNTGHMQMAATCFGYWLVPYWERLSDAGEEDKVAYLSIPMMA